MPGLIPPRSVVDTTDDPRHVPMRVTMTLDEPLVGDLARPLHLDGPLAWCAYVEWVEATGHRPPPIRPGESPLDFDLGLATWTMPPSGPVTDGRVLGADGLMWGWACSHHHPVAAARTAVAVRHKPCDKAMTRYTRDRTHHLATGPGRARNTILPAAWIGEITWWALGDPDRVASLLTRLRHIGRLGRHGYGRVARITVEQTSDRDAWRARSFPHPDGPMMDGVRAPYWHDTRQMPCATQ